MEFAVRVQGLDEPDGETCRWVLAIENERFLIVNPAGGFEWRDMSECTFVKMASPDNPRLVIPVQPQQQGPQLLTPNRVQRRALERNGGS